MDEHQRRMWEQMAAELGAFSVPHGDLRKLVEDVRGLFVAADPHNAQLRRDFESMWAPLDMELELRTEAWAPPGSASDDRLASGIAALRAWVLRVLSDPNSDHN